MNQSLVALASVLIVSSSFASDPQPTAKLFDRNGAIIATNEIKKPDLTQFSIEFEGRVYRADVLLAHARNGVFKLKQLQTLRSAVLDLGMDPALPPDVRNGAWSAISHELGKIENSAISELFREVRSGN